MSSWGWKPDLPEGIWRHGLKSFKYFGAALPWLTTGLIIILLYMVSGTLTSAKGVLFDLPTGPLTDGETTGLVALVMPTDHETLIFFDDSRYQLGDVLSSQNLTEHFAESIRRTGDKTLLTLADRRITSGELMAFAALARKGGFEKVLFAEKPEERVE